jgi:hypothetical protein
VHDDDFEAAEAAEVVVELAGAAAWLAVPPLQAASAPTVTAVAAVVESMATRLKPLLRPPARLNLCFTRHRFLPITAGSTVPVTSRAKFFQR